MVRWVATKVHCCSSRCSVIGAQFLSFLCRPLAARAVLCRPCRVIIIPSCDVRPPASCAPVFRCPRGSASLICLPWGPGCLSGLNGTLTGRCSITPGGAAPNVHPNVPRCSVFIGLFTAPLNGSPRHHLPKSWCIQGVSQKVYIFVL